MTRQFWIRHAVLCVLLIGASSRSLMAQATLSLTTGPCTNTGTLVVNLDLVQSTPVAVGAQVFLKYDNVRLQFVSADPGDAPFVQQVFESVNVGLGTIDYAVGIVGAGSGTTAPPTRTMARFTFNILASDCAASNLVTFRPSGPNSAPNRLSDNQVPGQSILPLTLNDLPATRLDIQPPAATSSGGLAACYPSQAAAEAAALALSSATDNCTNAPVAQVQTVGSCNATITVRYTDECGNLSNPLIYSTRIDGTAPSLTCPANITVTANTNECDAVVNYPAAVVSDNCDSAPTVHYSIPGGSVFPPGVTNVSVFAEDSCGNVSMTCHFTVTVNLLPTTLTLSSTGCQAGGTLVVKVDMSNACKVVVGGQYFLHYDPTKLQFVSADPGDAPFTRQVYEVVNTGLGRIDYATGIPDGGMGTSAPTTMARITFNVLVSDCNAATLVTFRPSGPNGIPNRLSDDSVPALPVLPLALVDLPAVTLDVTPPTITPPGNLTVECGPVPAAPLTVPATDNCDGSVMEATLNPDQVTPGSCPQNYVITRTWSVTDACGNVATGTQIITVQDTTPPTITCPPNTLVDCAAGVPAADFAGGSAADTCSGPPTVTHVDDVVSHQTCPNCYTLTRTYRATDGCGNSATCDQIITVQDTTPPTIHDCPVDILTNANVVSCSAVVTWAAPTVTDNCAGSTILQTAGPPSGSTFVNGSVTTITYTATDLAGLTSECSFTVSVVFFPDVNDDSVVDTNDIIPFINVLLGFDTDPIHIARSDVNCDGEVNGLDVQPFTDILTP